MLQGVLGALFWNKSVGLLEDLPEEDETYKEMKWGPERINHINDLYEKTAYNSWIAAGVNVAIGVGALIRLLCLSSCRR